MDLKSVLTILKSVQTQKFVIVGAIGSIIVLSSTWILTIIFNIFYAISAIISLEISLIIGFIIHEKWTFSSVIKKTKVRNRFIKYNFFSLIGFGINEAILIFLTHTLGVHYLLSEGIAIIITFVFNFTASKKITWKS